MRIMIVSPRFYPDSGGVENVALNQARGLVDLGHEVAIVTTVSEKSRTGHENIWGLEIHRCRAISPGDAYFFSTQLGRIVRKISKRYDIIHAHNYHSLPAFQAYMNKGEVPFVISCHYHRYSHKKFRNLLHYPYRKIARRMVEGANLVLCVSNSERKLLQQDFSPKDIGVNHNGVERAVNSWKGDISQGSSCVIGRLDRYKNVDSAIRAIGLIPNHVLNIIGMGPDEMRLRKIAKELDIEDRVVFHGFVETDVKREILANSSSLISLSDHESFGLTLIEGAMQGVPVIASNIPPHQEIAGIVGESISLVEPRDLEGIARFVAQASKRSGVASYHNLEAFTWEANVERLISAYQKVLT